MERSDENSISMTGAALRQGIPMEGVKYSMETRNANRRTFGEIENLIGGPAKAATMGKRPLQEREVTDLKINHGVLAGQRPMTRNFTAALERQRQPGSSFLPIGSERQKRALTVPENPVAGNSSCTAMEVNLPLQMAYEMEVMESPQFKEIEMEDISEDKEEDEVVEEEEEEEEEEIIPDIDSQDTNNPLAVVEYVEEIYDFYWKSEDNTRPIEIEMEDISEDEEEEVTPDIDSQYANNPTDFYSRSKDNTRPIEIEMEDISEDEEEEVTPDIDSQYANNPTDFYSRSKEKEDISEDEVEEIIPEIDIVDSNDPQAVTKYVEQIYDFYWRSEDASCVDPSYMSNQFDINERMRGILIDWLIEVHYKLELLDETLFLTVNLIDRFLAIQTITRKKLQLVGVTALLLACKYEEVTIPVVEDLIIICDRAYSRAELLEMERLMVNTLQFKMSVPTSYVFMKRFIKAALSDKKLELLSFFMVELCLVEYKMLQFTPSLLAAAAVFTAQCTLYGFQFWSKCSELHCRYTRDQLIECSRLMVELHQKAAQGKLTGVHRKFSTPKFGYAAKCEPALFLLDTTM